MNRPLIVGIAGGTASGKTSVCEYLLNKHSKINLTTLTIAVHLYSRT